MLSLTDEEKIQKQIKQRQEEAVKKGYNNLIAEAYNFLKYYPAWYKNGNEAWVHSDAKNIKELDSNHAISFDFGDNSYKLERKDGYMPNMCSLELYMNDELVFEISAVESGYLSDVDPTADVGAFLNENWVKDFVSLVSHYQEKSNKSTEEINRNWLLSQKKKFGIE